MMMLPTLTRTKPLAKDFILAGYLCIAIWTIILGSVASNSMGSATIDRCENSVKLTPISLLEGLCPGKVIMFICQIKSNNINEGRHLTWQSEEYIRDLIEITVFDNMPMIELTPDPMNLNVSYNATGTSLLMLKPRADAPNATVTCINQNANCSDSTSFRLLDAPDAPINITAEELPDNDPNDDSCMLHIRLCPPSNIDVKHIMHYFVQFPSGYQNISNTGAGCVMVPNCTQDIRLNVSAINTCGTVGASASDIKPLFIMESTTSTPTSSAIIGNTGAIVAIVAVVMVIIAVILITVIIVVIIVLNSKRKKPTEHKGYPLLPMETGSAEDKVTAQPVDQEVTSDPYAVQEKRIKKGKSPPQNPSASIYSDPGNLEKKGPETDMYAEPIKKKRQQTLTDAAVMHVASDEPAPKPPSSANLSEDIKELIKTEIQRVLSAKLSGVQEQDEKKKLLGNNDTESDDDDENSQCHAND